MIMGLVDLHSKHYYWSAYPILCHELIAEVMTRDLFDQLTIRLHFAYVEEGAPLQKDRMWKL